MGKMGKKGAKFFMFKKIGFIGCGNMGTALALAASKNINPQNILLANRRVQKAEILAQDIGAVVSTNAEIASVCDLIFLGVKPQMMGDMLGDIAEVLAARKDKFILVSMAAGLKTATIADMAGGEYPIIRIMPNTPVAVGAGVTLMCTKNVSQTEAAEYIAVMDKSGVTDEIPENLMDAGMAVSGCGTAYMCLFLEALADGGVACGLPRDKAILYAAQTMLGMGELVMQSGEHPTVLKDKICSPAGTTIEGVRALERGGIRAAGMDAVISAYEKAVAMGKGK